MKDVKLVIFDMDGLLFDTERPSYEAMRRVMKRRGYEFPIEHYKPIIGVADHECNMIMKEIYGSDFSFPAIVKDYRQEFDNILREEGLLIKPGAKNLLAALDRKGVKKCIASSSSRATIEYYLSLTSLTDRFDYYVSGEEVENGKPNPDIFLEACKRGKEETAASLVLEDSLNGLRAAVSAKIQCIIVPDLIEPNEEMKTNAYQIADDLNQVIELIK
ncbi:HAD family phosphatase [Neobacillus sp. OS1-32]|uniref:HAD family phosphatase n=1 Tax=Neobacillus paridis TaxID=2803862 RepID=A0ABS1TI50_9BACI|nr:MULTISPECIES: HAD family phosphatase [Neobacillus]MBL4950942.1 HAD family phosphatase [Neobacillus paridis]WML29970.1 HAD family phosphatase [Neobacillus sp. OS1-32]